jgi:hypothetical protein
MKKTNKLAATVGALELTKVAYPEQVTAVLNFLVSGDFLFQWRTDLNKPEMGWSSKFLTMPAVSSVFSDIPWETGWIPEGVVRQGCCEKGNFWMYYQPPKKVKISLLLSKPQTITIPIPATFMIGVGTETAHTHYLFAMKGNKFDPDAALYHAPFPNVYDDGKICWGLNQPPKVRAMNAGETWKIFFSLPFNGDLANGKSSSCEHDVRDMLLGLKKASIYPEKDLVRASESMYSILRRIIKED